MATDTLQSDFPQAIHERALPRAPAAARILSQFDRPALEGFIAVAIGVLDAIDGDPDAEAPGDEEEASGDESDQAWLEWHTRSAAGRRSPNCAGENEDDEADEEDCDGFESEPLFDRRSCKRLDKLFGCGAGCIVSEPDHGIEDLPQGTLGLDC